MERAVCTVGKFLMRETSLQKRSLARSFPLVASPLHGPLLPRGQLFRRSAGNDSQKCTLQ